MCSGIFVNKFFLLRCVSSISAC